MGKQDVQRNEKGRDTQLTPDGFLETKNREVTVKQQKKKKVFETSSSEAHIDDSVQCMQGIKMKFDLKNKQFYFCILIINVRP